MERTNEFNSLLKKKFRHKPNTDLQLINKIQSAVHKNDNTKELILMDQKLSKMKIIPHTEFVKSKDSEVFVTILHNLRSLKISNIKLTIKLQLKRLNQNKAALNDEFEGNGGTDNNFTEKGRVKSVVEKSVVKKRGFSIINSQINEISQIMDDLTSQINLQGIQIAKIDELREEAKSKISQTYFEIERKWKSISNRRKILILYLILWLVILLIFGILKKLK